MFNAYGLNTKLKLIESQLFFLLSFELFLKGLFVIEGFLSVPNSPFLLLRARFRRSARLFLAA